MVISLTKEEASRLPLIMRFGTDGLEEDEYIYFTPTGRNTGNTIPLILESDAKDTYIDMVNMLKERYHVGLINVSSIKVKAK